MSKMIERVVTQSVTVVRDGKRVSPPLNKAFSFTADEIEYLDRVSPRASRKPTDESLRRVVRSEGLEGETADEGDEEDAGDDETAPDKKAGPTASREPKRGGKGKAKAEAGDEDDDI
jgi:hypothetical protein